MPRLRNADDLASAYAGPSTLLSFQFVHMNCIYVWATFGDLHRHGSPWHITGYPPPLRPSLPPFRGPPSIFSTPRFLTRGFLLVLSIFQELFSRDRRAFIMGLLPLHRPAPTPPHSSPPSPPPLIIANRCRRSCYSHRGRRQASQGEYS